MNGTIIRGSGRGFWGRGLLPHVRDTVYKEVSRGERGWEAIIRGLGSGGGGLNYYRFNHSGGGR